MSYFMRNTYRIRTYVLSKFILQLKYDGNTPIFTIIDSYLKGYKRKLHVSHYL